MAQGYIRKRGARSWQLRYDAPRGADGKRRHRYETVRGTKRQAQSRLTEILGALNKGDYREPTESDVKYMAISIAAYLGCSSFDWYINEPHWCPVK